MTAAPYYLLAAGIVLVIIGYIVAAGFGGGRSDFIDPKMSDKEIARRVKESQGSPFGGAIMLLGCLVILASIAWRVVRFFI